MLITAIIFFVILGILVFVHELGHFAVAKWIGVKVEEFGFGLPPRVWGKKFGETMYSLNWLPIGGFVKLAGEDEPPSAKATGGKASAKQYFWARSKKERAAILLAGVTMNFLMAVGITTFLLTRGVNEPTGRVHVEKVAPGSPAQEIGLQKGDIVLTAKNAMTLNVGAKKIRKPDDLINFVKDNAGKPVLLEVERGQEKFPLTVTPRLDPPPGEGALGVAISDLEKRQYSLVQAPVKAVEINVLRMRDMFAGLGTLVSRIAQRKSVDGDVAGPIGIAVITDQARKFGWEAVLEFMSILSLNLAVINILPIPPMDGGRLAFVIAEKILRRKVAPAFEKSVHQVGMILVLIFFVLISLNDILKLTRGG